MTPAIPARKPKKELGSRLRGPNSHAYFAPMVANAFEELDVSVTLWETGTWTELIERPLATTLPSFELLHGRGAERFAYNQRCLRRARSRGESVLGVHGGLSDLFVPVPKARGADAVLVTGPFATIRPTSTSLLSRWQAVTGRQGHPLDPEFREYAALVLSTLVLEGVEIEHFRRLVECLATLMAGGGAADALFGEVNMLRGELASTRRVAYAFRSVASMVDEPTCAAWSSPHMASRLWPLGLTRAPEALVVGLFVSRDTTIDPVDELVRVYDMQCACSDLARKNSAAAGQVGDRGVVFVGARDARGSVTALRRRLVTLGDQAVTLARRRFGLDLHFGQPESSGSLSSQHQQALAAAHAAVAAGVRWSTTAVSSRIDVPLAGLRAELASPIDGPPSARIALFDRYVDAVLVSTGHRVDIARPHLDAGLERVAEAWLGIGAARSSLFTEIILEVASRRDVRTPSELAAAYRRAIADMLESTARPSLSHQQRSLRRAEAYMRQHYMEALSLAHVARVGGYAPNYFSRLFHESYSATFEQYLIAIRIERAKQLLRTTDIRLESVGNLCGFSTRQHFGAAFRRVVGETPGRFRARDRRTLGVGGGESDARRKRAGRAP